MDRLENLVGAWAVTLTDRQLAATPGERGTVTDAAALLTLLAHPDRTVAWLADVLALTSSGATRLVARLAAARLVTRTPGADSRERRVRLTAAGTRQARAAARRRETALSAALAGLSAAQRTQLEGLLETLVAESADRRLPALRTCRLCDRAACARGGAQCPLEHTVDPADPHA